jgi:flagellar basal body-associated protein FliL
MVAMNPAKAKVKGSPVYRMKVVPHRPLKNALIILALLTLISAAFAVIYFYALNQASNERLSPEEAQELRARLDQLTQETNESKRELAKYQLNAEVDRQAGEELRKRVMVLRDEKAALQRDVEVYRILTSKKSTNPMGIGFGIFSVSALADNKKQFKLVVQKLAEGDDDFSGQLRVLVVGQKDGAEAKISLHELVVSKADVDPVAENIPLNFKFFQNIDTEIVLPDGFVPVRVELAVKSSSRRNPVTVEAELEWPEIK